jgi:electron transfer flavoprotein alpha/beta subunit
VTDAGASTTRAVRLVVLVQRLHQALDQPAPALLGRCERAALEAAVALASRLGGTLTALSMGADEHQRPVLAAALAAGCHAAVRVHAPSCDDLDYLGVATILGAAARALGCDALLCGDTSENERTGAVGPAVAEILGVPHLTGVLAIAAGPAGAPAAPRGALGGAPGGAPAAPRGAPAAPGGAPSGAPGGALPDVMVEHRSGGFIHRLRWPLPAVFCLLAPVVAATGRDTAAAARPGGEAGAADAGITTLTLDALGLDARALAHRRRLAGRAHTDAGDGATVVTSADELVARLVAEGILH